MQLLGKLLAFGLGLAVVAGVERPAEAAAIKPVSVFTGQGLVTDVGKRRRYRRRAAIAGAVIGGVIIGGAIANHRRRYNGPVYYQRPRYHAPRYYVPRSHAPRYHTPRYRYRQVYRPQVYRPRVYRPAPVYRSQGGSHTRWCYNRYRSYRSWDNTFQPYHGPRRHCRSPYG